MSLLTGPEIENYISSGEITISPYNPENVGPNSVDLCLHSELKAYSLPDGYLDAENENPTYRIPLEDDGTFLLKPGILYLGRTVEKIGSNRFVPIVEGRSSIGRLGCQVHMTAGVGDLGFLGTITLEIAVIHPLKIKPLSRICQALWLSTQGIPRLYKGRYQGQIDATPSRFSWHGYMPSQSPTVLPKPHEDH